MSHVHLVEGFLGQQGLHQGPGHGCVVCVVQCFCRDRWGKGEIQLQGFGWQLWLPTCSFYSPFPPHLKSALSSHPVSWAQDLGIFSILYFRSVTTSCWYLKENLPPPSDCHHCISSLNTTCCGPLKAAQSPPLAQSVSAARKSFLTVENRFPHLTLLLKMAVCCPQGEVQIHCLSLEALPSQAPLSSPILYPLLLYTQPRNQSQRLGFVLPSGGCSPAPPALFPSSGGTGLLTQRRHWLYGDFLNRLQASWDRDLVLSEGRAHALVSPSSCSSCLRSHPSRCTTAPKPFPLPFHS